MFDDTVARDYGINTLDNEDKSDEDDNNNDEDANINYGP